MGQFKNIKVLSNSTYTVSQYDQVIHISLSALTSDITLTLPDISTGNTNAIGYGWRLSVVCTDLEISEYTVTIQAAGSDTIDGSSSFVLNTNNTFSVFVEYVDEGLWKIEQGGSGGGGGGSCVRWVYQTGTTAAGIQSTEVKFNNATLTAATEIYISTTAFTGNNYWYNYFNKLVTSLCCTLTVSLPSDENQYIVFDYNPSASTLESNYLIFGISNQFSAPLVNDSYFTGLTDGQELCLDFDLFRCENFQTPGGGGTEEVFACETYYQFSATSISAITNTGNVFFNNLVLPGNNGEGQFTYALTGGTQSSYTLNVGDPIFFHFDVFTYWGNWINALPYPGVIVELLEYTQTGSAPTGEGFRFSYNPTYIIM